MPAFPAPSAAELYTALHTGNPGDVAHYLTVCRPGQRVLELGSGAGRIALPLAQAGSVTVGLELDADLCELARREAFAQGTALLTYIQGDARDFDLPHRFDRVLLPYNVLYCLGGARGVERCLHRVAQHLLPGGEVWLDAYWADPFHADADEAAPDDDEPVAHLELPGGALTVLERSAWNRELQRLDVQYAFLDAQDRLCAVQSLTHDYLLRAQVEQLLSGAGFELLHSSLGFPQPSDPSAPSAPSAVASDADDEDGEAEGGEILVLGARRA